MRNSDKAIEYYQNFFVWLCPYRDVKFCPGTTFCKSGKQDSVKLGMEFDRKYHGMELPSKFKIGVSGCTTSCAESEIEDLGGIGMPKGLEGRCWWFCGCSTSDCRGSGRECERDDSLPALPCGCYREAGKRYSTAYAT